MSRAWMPMYWGDYLADTANLTTTEHGAYLLLIAHYWQHGGLPTDPRALRRIAKISNFQCYKILTVLSQYFEPGWKHSRIERELAKANAIQLKRQLYGAKGGFASRGKTNMQRHIAAQLPPKQRGDQSQSPSNLTYFELAARAKRRRTSEEER